MAIDIKSKKVNNVIISHHRQQNKDPVSQTQMALKTKTEDQGS